MKKRTKGIDTCDNCSGHLWQSGILTKEENLRMLARRVVQTLQHFIKGHWICSVCGSKCD